MAQIQIYGTLPGGSGNLQNKDVTITENTETIIEPDSGYDGLESVKVTTNVSQDMSDYFGNITGSSSGQAVGTTWMAGIKKMSNFTISGTTAQQLFRNFKGTSIDFFNVDTSAITNTSYMFKDCTNLNNITLFDTSNVTNMENMFENCELLANVPFFDTSKVNKTNYMFQGCSSLTSIPAFNISEVTDMRYMFFRCTLLTTLPILNTSNVTLIGDAFKGCPNLSNDSINNILQMCINATKVSYKKLNNSVDNYVLEIVPSLSNYQAFLDAGWSLT